MMEQDISIICWQSLKTRPVEERYVLIREPDEEVGMVCSCVFYEKGGFWCCGQRLPESGINGWAYLPYETN